jgi:hypothetical protein
MITSGGGSGSDGGCVMSRLTLKGIDRLRALQELKSLIEAQLSKSGFSFKGGSSGGGGDAAYFSYHITSAHSVGTLTVASVQTSPQDILIVMSIAQIQRQ